MQLSNRMALVLACFSLVLVQASNAEESKTTPQVTDISLRANGVLIGQVVNSQGKSVSAAKVTVYHGRDVIAQATTDRNGGFMVRKLRGGMHRVTAGQGVEVVRLWTTKAAPPSSRSTLTIVSDKNVVRGQCGESGCTGECGDEGCGVAGAGFLGLGGGGLAGTAGIVATAAVVGGVLAAALDDDDDPASP